VGVVVEFGILGPLVVRVDGLRVQVTAHREIAILATLLFRADQVVSTDQLVDIVWTGDLPANPANQIAICVLSLRRKLVSFGAPADLIATRPPGYLVQLGDARLDTRQVQSLTAAATAAEAVGDREEALEHLRAAVGLWRGPVLPSLANTSLAPEIVRWEERRAALFDRRVQLELDLGRHHDVIGELSAVVAEQGLRERPREQLMIALCRAGRPAQALSVYRVTRKMFLDELGIEPSSQLRRVYEAIRSGAVRGA
jgi:DNA-binding SARP family transcriptional activator